MRPRWKSGPTSITLVRHGESLGNRADEQAREAGAERLDLDERDADVELSGAGQEQAASVGAWLTDADGSWAPTVVLTSPFRRASATAHTAMERAGLEVVMDERLRERDLGLFDGMTGHGIRTRFPDEADRRKKVGKFYYQPPSGESWADVVLRVRSLLNDLRHGYDGERVWMFTHQAVIMSFRYALEGLSEQDLLDIDREIQIPNASFTRFDRAGDEFELGCFADTRGVDGEDAEVTHVASQRGRHDEHP